MTLWLCLLLALGAALLYVVLRVLVRQRRPRAQPSELQAVAAALAKKHRISIVGCCCTGKSTLAHTLAKIKGVRHIELDSLAWLPGWQNRDREEFSAMLSQQIQEAKALSTPKSSTPCTGFRAHGPFVCRYLYLHLSIYLIGIFVISYQYIRTHRDVRGQAMP